MCSFQLYSQIMPNISSNHPAFKAIRQSLLWEVRGLFLIGAATLILGIILSTLLTSNWIGLTLAAIILLVGLYICGNAWKVWDVDKSPLLKILRYQPERIVWVYSVVTQRMPFGFKFSQNGTLYFKMIDGQDYSVSLPSKYLSYVSKSLQKHLPMATFGYTRDREQWYMASPELLIKYNEEPKAKK